MAELKVSKDYNGVEVMLHLQAAGIIGGLSTRREPDGLVIVSDATAATLEAAMATFAATTPPGGVYVPPMPDVVKAAGRIVHRLAYATDDELAALTNAELRVALRALARGEVWLNRDLDVSD